VVDDEGEKTTVTLSVDGQTVRQTTTQKKNGEQETVEDLINMDESKCTTCAISITTFLLNEMQNPTWLYDCGIVFIGIQSLIHIILLCFWSMSEGSTRFAAVTLTSAL